eukprot:10042527-Prorocentrum_lima.AAC.1
MPSSASFTCLTSCSNAAVGAVSSICMTSSVRGRRDGGRASLEAPDIVGLVVCPTRAEAQPTEACATCGVPGCAV